MPCSPPKPAPTTSCSASRTPTGRRPSFEAIVERVAWWAEVFETPCVGFAATLDEVEPLAAAGADFVARRRLRASATRAAAAVAVADAARRLAVAETIA